MNITKKLMIAAGLFFQLSNLYTMNEALSVFQIAMPGGLQPNTLTYAQARDLAAKAGNTAEAQALALYTVQGGRNLNNKRLFPKGVNIDVAAELAANTAPALSSSAAAASVEANPAVKAQLERMIAANPKAEAIKDMPTGPAKNKELAKAAADKLYQAIEMLPREEQEDIHAMLDRQHPAGVAAASFSSNHNLGRLGNNNNNKNKKNNKSAKSKAKKGKKGQKAQSEKTTNGSGSGSANS